MPPAWPRAFGRCASPGRLGAAGLLPRPEGGRGRQERLLALRCYGRIACRMDLWTRLPPGPGRQPALRRHVRAAGAGLARGGQHHARLTCWAASPTTWAASSPIACWGLCLGWRAGPSCWPGSSAGSPSRWAWRCCSASSPRGRLALWRPVTSAVNQLKSRMSVLLRRRSFAALAVLGLLNGLLPCGLVYVACAGAAATGGILAGASYMAAFGVGTVPMMLAHQSLREAGPDLAAPQTGEDHPRLRLPARHAADPARHVPGHPLCQPRHVRQRRVLLPQIAFAGNVFDELRPTRNTRGDPVTVRHRRPTQV